MKPIFTLNNMAFTNDSNEIAKFYLRGETDADRIYLGASYIAQNSNVFVINANYDALYEYFKGSTIPINAQTKVTNINIP